jgi:hypothetical protein
MYKHTNVQIYKTHINNYKIVQTMSNYYDHEQCGEMFWYFRLVFFCVCLYKWSCELSFEATLV